MIKILYNALHLTGQFSGVQHTEECLMREAFLHPDPDICLEVLCPEDYGAVFSVQSFGQLVHVGVDGSQQWQRIGYEHFLMNRRLRSQQVDILHCPAYILPWHRNVPGIVTVHDTIALDFPAYCPAVSQAWFRFALPRSICHATKIIAVSHTVKKDILRRFPTVPAEKIEVIYHGINEIFRKMPSVEKLGEVHRKYWLPEKFILFVGNIEPKKNIVRLTDAFLRLIKYADIPHSLVIAGRFAWKYRDVLQKAAFQGNNGRILFPGYVAQSDLPAVYSLADMFVFPSLYEGFGIPPLEAMACGVPVIVSNAGALPEITAGNALLVDPLSVTSIEKSMYQLLHNRALRYRLVEGGRLHARKFRWKSTWKATANLYKSVIINSPRNYA